MRTPGRIAAAALLALSLAATARAEGEQEPPSIGTDDLVLLTDGRLLRGHVPARTKDAVTFLWRVRTITIPSDRVEAVYLARDYDSTPRDDAERTQRARGLARWDGKWVTLGQARVEFGRLASRLALGDDADHLHATWETRHRVETNHFRIESNLPRSDIRFYETLLETYVAFAKRVLDMDPGERRALVHIHRDDATYATARRALRGAPESMVGWFDPRGDGSITLFQMPGDREQTLRVLLHEATHFLLHRKGLHGIPLWINEGLCEFLGGYRYSRGKFIGAGVPAGRLLHYRAMEEAGRVRDLGALEPIGVRAPIDLDAYAQAWATVAFLMTSSNANYRGRFLRALETWRKESAAGGKRGPAHPPAYPNLGADDVLALVGARSDADLRARIRRFQEPLSADDPYALAMFAFAREREKDGPPADPLLAEARRLAEGDAETLTLLGRVALLRKRPAEARDHFAAALVADPLATEARVGAALVAEPLDPAHITEEIAYARALDPSNPALLLGPAEHVFKTRVGRKARAAPVDAPAVSKAFDWAVEAQRLLPHEQVAATVVQLGIACGRFDESAPVAKRLLREAKEPGLAVIMRTRLAAAMRDGPAWTEAMARVTVLETELARGRKPTLLRPLRMFLVRGAIPVAAAWPATPEADTALVEVLFECASPEKDVEAAALVAMARRTDNDSLSLLVVAEAQRRFPGSGIVEDAAKCERETLDRKDRAWAPHLLAPELDAFD